MCLLARVVALNARQILEPNYNYSVGRRGVGPTEIPAINVLKVRGFSYLGNTKDRMRGLPHESGVGASLIRGCCAPFNPKLTHPFGSSALALVGLAVSSMIADPWISHRETSSAENGQVYGT